MQEGYSGRTKNNIIIQGKLYIQSKMITRGRDTDQLSKQRSGSIGKQQVSRLGRSSVDVSDLLTGVQQQTNNERYKRQASQNHDDIKQVRGTGGGSGGGGAFFNNQVHNNNHPQAATINPMKHATTSSHKSVFANSTASSTMFQQAFSMPLNGDKGGSRLQ